MSHLTLDSFSGLEQQHENLAKKMLQTTSELTLNSTFSKPQQLLQSLKGLTCHIKSARGDVKRIFIIITALIMTITQATLTTHVPTSREELVQYLKLLGPKPRQNQTCLWGYHNILLEPKKSRLYNYQFSNTFPFEVYKAEFLALLKLVIFL